jgi:trehalose synthase
MRDVGVDAHWHVIFGKEEFFNATKLLHNSLQGARRRSATSSGRSSTRSTDQRRGPEGEWDTIIVHDPQPIGPAPRRQEKSRNWVWRCHIDLSSRTRRRSPACSR